MIGYRALSISICQLGALVMEPNSAVHRFEYYGWSVAVELEGVSSDGVISGHADLHCEGDHKCRIALSGKYADGARAISSLADRSRAFIDEWHTELVNGNLAPPDREAK
jgi:hypothetical protein